MWLVVANFLVSETLFLSSGHDQVMMFLWISSKQMLFSVLTRKGKVRKQNFHPLRSWFWLREGRSQLEACTGQGPQTPPSSHRWGSQCPTHWSSGFSGPPNGGWGGRWESWRLWPRHTDTTIRSQRQGCVGWGCGGIHCCLKAWAQSVGSISEGPRALQDTAPSLFPGPPAHLLAQGQMSWKAPGRRLGSPSYLTFHLMTTTPPTVGWVTHWWKLTDSFSLVDRAHCGTDQGLSRTPEGPAVTVAVNRVWGNGTQQQPVLRAALGWAILQSLYYTQDFFPLQC